MSFVYLKIEEIRKRKGVTKSHIARSCGHTPQWYSKVSKGEIVLDVNKLELIASILEEDVKNFFDNKLSDTLNLSIKKLA
ncbi:helix-turn-helix domain-containing protein [Lysinibacillus sp. NPDC097162]|uniref:helix-turn-helix domain-containing protein n=1 Tax=Lysinibacillus sp. NPDC097162 TaxID=3364140 RepID=UPI00382265ED